MATKRDYYEVLGLSKGASEDEIKKYMECLEQTGVIERDITGSYCISEYLSYR